MYIAASLAPFDTSLSQTITGGISLVIFIAIVIIGSRHINKITGNLQDQIDGMYTNIWINIAKRVNEKQQFIVI